MIWVSCNVVVVFVMISVNNLMGVEKGLLLIVYSCLGMAIISIKSILASFNMIGTFIFKRPITHKK